MRDPSANIANEAQMATFLVKETLSSSFEDGYEALARPNNVEDIVLSLVNPFWVVSFPRRDLNEEGAFREEKLRG